MYLNQLLETHPITEDINSKVMKELGVIKKDDNDDDTVP